MIMTTSNPMLYRNVYEIVFYIQEIERFRGEIIESKLNIIELEPNFKDVAASEVCLMGNTTSGNKSFSIYYKKSFPDLEYSLDFHINQVKKISLTFNTIREMIIAANRFIKIHE